MKKRKKPAGKIVTRKQAQANAKLLKMQEQDEKIIDPAIKFKVSEDREREKQISRDKDIAAAIYTRWKNKFINRRKTLDEVTLAVNELAEELDARIESDWKTWVISNILHPIIQSLHDRAILQRFSVAALIDCPGKNKSGADCEWGGIGRFHQHVWDAGDAEMKCPECGHLCKQANDMMLEKDAREQFAEHVKAIEKGGTK